MGACHPLQIPLGLALWLLWFGAAYGGLSVGCALAPPAAGAGPFNWLNLALVLSALATVVLLGWLALRCWRGSRRAGDAGRRFVGRLAAAVHLTGAVATVFVAAPLLRLPPCL